VANFDLDKSNEMHKYAAVLGSPDDGLFECFEHTAAGRPGPIPSKISSLMKLVNCTYPSD